MTLTDGKILGIDDGPGLVPDGRVDGKVVGSALGETLLDGCELGITDGSKTSLLGNGLGTDDGLLLCDGDEVGNALGRGWLGNTLGNALGIS